MKKTLNKKGITLVELIITLSLLAILMGAVTYVIATPMRASVRLWQVNHASRIVYALRDYMVSELVFISEVELSSVRGLDFSMENTTVTENGIAYRRIHFTNPRAASFNDIQIGGNFNVSFEASRRDDDGNILPDDVLRIVITVSARDGGELVPIYTRGFTVWCVNLHLHGHTVGGSTNGTYEVINYSP